MAKCLHSLLLTERGGALLGSNDSEKDGGCGGHPLNASPQCDDVATKAGVLLGCIKKETIQSEWGRFCYLCIRR